MHNTPKVLVASKSIAIYILNMMHQPNGKLEYYLISYKKYIAIGQSQTDKSCPF